MSVPASTDDKRSTPAELWERKDVLAYFGGKRPLHTSTLYRGIHDGLYPRPIRVSRTHVRWLRSECEAALDRMIAARDGPRKQTGMVYYFVSGLTTPAARSFGIYLVWTSIRS